MLCNLLWSVFGVVVWSDPDSFLGVVCLEERTLWWWGNKARQVDQRVGRTVIRLRGRGLDAPLFGSVELVCWHIVWRVYSSKRSYWGWGYGRTWNLTHSTTFFCDQMLLLVIWGIMEYWRWQWRIANALFDQMMLCFLQTYWGAGRNLKLNQAPYGGILSLGACKCVPRNRSVLCTSSVKLPSCNSLKCVD